MWRCVAARCPGNTMASSKLKWLTVHTVRNEPSWPLWLMLAFELVKSPTSMPENPTVGERSAAGGAAAAGDAVVGDAAVGGAVVDGAGAAAGAAVVGAAVLGEPGAAATTGLAAVESLGVASASGGSPGATDVGATPAPGRPPGGPAGDAPGAVAGWVVVEASGSPVGPAWSSPSRSPMMGSDSDAGAARSPAAGSESGLASSKAKSSGLRSIVGIPIASSGSSPEPRAKTPAAIDTTTAAASKPLRWKDPMTGLTTRHRWALSPTPVIALDENSRSREAFFASGARSRDDATSC